MTNRCARGWGCDDFANIEDAWLWSVKYFTEKCEKNLLRNTSIEDHEGVVPKREESRPGSGRSLLHKSIGMVSSPRIPPRNQLRNGTGFLILLRRWNAAEAKV